MLDDAEYATIRADFAFTLPFLKNNILYKLYLRIRQCRFTYLSAKCFDYNIYLYSSLAFAL